ncbi:MAG TPA: efflux RND transporter periplasmic adaptor subunit [Xanthobacteraceae bacterium]|jgi:multidrug efflux system membrane fusion protein
MGSVILGTRWRRRNRLAALVLAVVAGGGAFYYWHNLSSEGTDAGRSARAPARVAVPVSVAIASRRDVPIYLTGLGTVQPSSSVGIHSQVDGKLQEVPFTEGQHVKKGDVLARIDPRLFKAALDQAKAKKAQDEALLGSAQKDLNRFKTLALKNFESQQNVDLQQGKVDQLTAALDADDAAIETAQTQLDYTTITAPSDGRVGVRLVDPGNVVHASDAGPIATLMLAQPAAVMFTLPSRVLDDVREAMNRGAIEVIAYDQDNRLALSTGKLLLVDNAVDQATSTIRLKAIFANADDRLWPGEFVNARLLLETRSNVVAVPSNAIQRGPKGLFAWTVTADDTAVARQIQVGPTAGDLTIITSGLNEGDRVVTEGQYKLQANAPVSVRSPPAASTERSAT